MNRTTRTVVVVCVALLCASAATYVVYTAVRSMPQRQQETTTAMVVVAARKLPAGTLIRREDLKLVKMSADAVVPGSLSKLEHAVDRGLRTPLEPNEAVIDSRLGAPGAGVGLEASIPHGMRAVSVRVDDVIGVAGFVGSGTHVDLVATVRSQGANSREPVSRTILSNVLVLSYGTRRDQETTKDVKPVPVITLAVTPDDAERITLAASEGKISLTLRNPHDDAPTATAGIGVTALIRGSAPAEPVEKPVVRRAAPAPKVEPVVLAPAPPIVEDKYTVEVIRAAKLTEQEVR